MGKVGRKGGSFEKLKKAIKDIGSYRGKVGFFEDAVYADGTPVALVASVQEFGNENIPPRSFMRTTMVEQQKPWANLARSGAKAVLNNKAAPDQVMEGVTLQAAGDVRKKITEITSPELDENTIKARARKLASGKISGGLKKPLVESGLMLSSVRNEVERK